jgi:hypothetical protein
MMGLGVKEYLFRKVCYFMEGKQHFVQCQAKTYLFSANPCSVSRLLNTLLKLKLLHLGCSCELGTRSCLMR